MELAILLKNALLKAAPMQEVVLRVLAFAAHLHLDVAPLSQKIQHILNLCQPSVQVLAQLRSANAPVTFVK